MVTRRELILAEMKSHGETWDDVVDYVIGRDRWIDDDVVPSLDREFDNGYGGTCGDPFTLWTNKRVYFGTEYDGSEGVASVPRNPCQEVVDPV